MTYNWPGRKQENIFYQKKKLFTFRDRVKVPIFWPPDVKSQLTGKDLDAAKDCM